MGPRQYGIILCELFKVNNKTSFVEDVRTVDNVDDACPLENVYPSILLPLRFLAYHDSFSATSATLLAYFVICDLCFYMFLEEF